MRCKTLLLWVKLAFGQRVICSLIAFEVFSDYIGRVDLLLFLFGIRSIMRRSAEIPFIFLPSPDICISFITNRSNPFLIFGQMNYPLLNKLILQFMVNHFPWNKIIAFDIFLDFRHIIDQILNSVVFFDNFWPRNHNDLRFINQVFLIVWYTGLVTEGFYLLLLQLYHQLLLSFLVLNLSLLVVLLKLNVLRLWLDYVHLRCWDGLCVHVLGCIRDCLV